VGATIDVVKQSMVPAVDGRATTRLLTTAGRQGRARPSFVTLEMEGGVRRRKDARGRASHASQRAVNSLASSLRVFGALTSLRRRIARKLASRGTVDRWGVSAVVRSIPEKTFEHWASMYVAHRFPLGGLWWPTVGEDIRVEDLGTLPGKALLLEAKVPELKADGSHVVTIDVAQLRKYVASVAPVYYTFPAPPWTGDLTTSAWLGIERRADLAYKRAGHRWSEGGLWYARPVLSSLTWRLLRVRSRQP
jgi:hypothetical protein